MRFVQTRKFDRAKRLVTPEKKVQFVAANSVRDIICREHLQSRESFLRWVGGWLV